ncbi:hypothetical protein FSP39_011586 [Pinctada imbricata]|uniref:G-protein coupled receptors family 1 profile domain-containing protein n=1 Tax=Pinctada imbricata TaxID=66713 RepID=A0AA89BWW6_PINIB|nr:hypothetical protein FSP39_011586 [Pinctada imbricata]
MYPLRPRLTKRVVLAITVIWMVSTIVSFPNLLFAKTEFDPDNNRTVCYIKWPDYPNSTSELVYSSILTLVNYVLPLGTLTVTYIQIGVELWGSRAIGEDTPVQLERIKSKRKVVKMMIVVVIIFALCWLPYHLYFIVAATATHISEYRYIQHIYLVIYWLAMSNSMYNPIIYCWMNSRFRHGFIQAFCCCPFKRCKRIKNKTKQGRPLFPDTNNTYAMTHKNDRNGSMSHTMTEMLENSSSSPNMKRKIIRKNNDFL